ncbi:hypothetical protein VUR80DRAFT_23 [Thermomyces stellatus]
MRPLAVLLVATGAVSAATLHAQAQEAALVARQDRAQRVGAGEEAAAEEQAGQEGEQNVENENAAREQNIDENQDAEEEEGAEEELNQEELNQKDEEAAEAEEDISSEIQGSINFDGFGLNDFVALGINDILQINNLAVHEANLAIALAAMLNAFGLNNVLSVNEITAFGFEDELQMFLALQQIGNLVALGQIGVNDAFGLVHNGLVGNRLNFGVNGLKGLNAFNLLGLGGGRSIHAVI